MMMALTSMLALLQFPEADVSIKDVCGETDMYKSVARQLMHDTKALTLSYGLQTVTKFEDNHIVF